MDKKIIWALFDDGAGSGRNCGYDTSKYQIISIGIKDNDWDNYFKIDLRVSNEALIKQLNKLPKPGAIVASPPCESGSNAWVQYRLLRKIENKAITLFNIDDYVERTRIEKKKYDYFKKGSTFLIGVDTATATEAIIKHFKPKYYLIENPQSSLIGRFYAAFGVLMRDNFALNLAYYNNYDASFPKKPTYFLANLRMELKHKTIISGVTVNHRYAKRARVEIKKVVNDYDTKSSIPKELLMHILKEFEDNESKR